MIQIHIRMILNVLKITRVAMKTFLFSSNSILTVITITFMAKLLPILLVLSYNY